ncbi:AEC family transporter [Pararhodonellum marinum]|uniref:AEC family transporter n=1 Tax=Pararhodonellum marinum TaxID=2755358 RepID=UPI00188F1BC5|nr:AEC family transporter [Pararhodonellum marinum]
MENIVLIIISLLIGIFLQGIKEIPKDASKSLNAYLIYVVLPALALLYLPKIDFGLAYLLPVLSAYLSFFLSWVLFAYLGKTFSWPKSTTGCLIITAGLANTSFVGFPIIDALYGEEGLKIALLIDQAGSFIIVSSLAIVVASIYGIEKKRKRDIGKKIVTFPPFAFFGLALILNFLGWEAEGSIMKILETFAKTLTPIALISVGLQIKIEPKAIKSGFLWMGLGYKLLLIPMVVYVIYAKILSQEGYFLKVTVMENAMAPMITGSIIAISHDLNPRLASLLVGVGIPLSFFTLWAWYLFLG